MRRSSSVTWSLRGLRDSCETDDPSGGWQAGRHDRCGLRAQPHRVRENCLGMRVLPSLLNRLLHLVRSGPGLLGGVSSPTSLVTSALRGTSFWWQLPVRMAGTGSGARDLLTLGKRANWPSPAVSVFLGLETMP
jgi:hypothetical protein